MVPCFVWRPKSPSLCPISKRVAVKKSVSVSRFIQRAVEKSLQNDAEFLAMTEQAMLVRNRRSCHTQGAGLGKKGPDTEKAQSTV